MAVRAPATERSTAQADERLLVEAAQKDPSRFAELYELHFERVYAFVVRRVSDRAAAEDLTSDVFHKALVHLKTYEWRGVPFGAWLLKIAANAITDLVKRGGREIAYDEPPEISSKPRMEQVEERTKLYQMVNGLPEDQRSVVVMRFAEEKSIKEIAQAIGRSEGAVKQLQFRAVQNLRQGFETKTGKAETRKSGGRNG